MSFKKIDANEKSLEYGLANGTDSTNVEVWRVSNPKQIYLLARDAKGFAYCYMTKQTARDLAKYLMKITKEK